MYIQTNVGLLYCVGSDSNVAVPLDLTSPWKHGNEKQDSQCTYTCKIGKRSCNHCCSENTTSITYCECVFLVLSYPVCNANAPFCHLWPAPLCIFFFPHYFINDKIFENHYWTQNVCFDFLYNIYLKHSSF